MHVLAIDTSTGRITATVATVSTPSELIEQAQAGRRAEPVTLLASGQVDDQFAHAEALMPLIRRVVGEAGIALSDLSAIVVGVGPGPYTGLRVGIATAAALGDALELPVHPVPSHDAIAASVGALGDPLVVITDARRREVYLSLYDPQLRRVAGPAVIARDQVPQWLAEQPVAPAAMSGPGCALTSLTLPERPVGEIGLGAVTVAGRALVTGAIPGPLTPLYLRRPDAVPPKPVKSVIG